MSFINTTVACDYKLKCLEIAVISGLTPEAQITYAKDMFAWVVSDHVQTEVKHRTTLVPMAPTEPFTADDATVERLKDALAKTYK